MRVTPFRHLAGKKKHCVRKVYGSSLGLVGGIMVKVSFPPFNKYSNTRLRPSGAIYQWATASCADLKYRFNLLLCLFDCGCATVGLWVGGRVGSHFVCL